MKLFSRIKSTSQRFLRIITLLPLLSMISLLTIYSPAYAETGEDSQKADAVEFSQAELDQILAPIALYPDTILSQVLIASTYPIEVVQADRWVRTNPSAKGADAVKLVDDKDWDPSVKALVAFPDILKRMSDDIDWTQKLGDAFLNDEGRVMDSIQSLRKKAYASGSLNKVKHLKVQREDDEIVIEPAEERVVYVPVYDTRVVYGNWWWPEYPPVYWHYPNYTYVSGFYWGPSIFIGPSFFYSSCHWRQRHVVVVDHYHHYNDRNPRPYFYTGRSIVHYEGARAWQHAPIHRRGVAYYNNRLRDNYGSRHESYRDAHTYRDQHRERRTETRPDNYTPTHPQTRFDDNHRGNSRIAPSNGIRFAEPGREATTPPVDRAEQLRDRMQRTRDVNNSNPRNSGNSENIDRTLNRTDNRNDRESRNDNPNNERQNNARQDNARQSIEDSMGDSNRNRHIDRGANRHAPAERSDHPDYGNAARDPNAQVNRTENEPARRTETTRPVVNDDNSRGSRLDQIQQDRSQSRVDPNVNRTMRVDDSSNRRAEMAPREERGNNDGGGSRIRGGGGSREDDRGRR